MVYPIPASNMDFDAIPDDIWIEVFEHIDDPLPLSILTRTCHRFLLLARRPLLRDIRWIKPRSTQRSLDLWERNSFYLNSRALPRKITVGIEFEFAGRAVNLTNAETRLHDSVWECLPLFSSLNELVLDGTTISVYAYTILAQIPSLRKLSITNCTYIRLPTTFTQQAQQNPLTPYPTSFPFADLPLTHLSIQKLQGAFDSIGFHPFNLVASSALTSLSVTWTGSIAQAYSSRRRTLHSLTELDITMPVLTRDLVDSLVQFVDACTLAPRVRLSIDRHNLSDQQLGTVSVPLRNVCYFHGPLPISSFGMSHHQVRSHGANASLREVRMNDPVDLRGLLEGLESLTSGIERLELMVSKWDIEILFAIRELFPGIQELVIRYGTGTFSSDLFVTLGANILFDLPQLATVKLYQDPSCILVTRQANAASTSNPFQAMLATLNGDFDDDHHPMHLHELDDPSSSDSLSMEGMGIEHGDLEDYLIGWNRYCKQLRHVQVREDMWWKRGFEGDVWREVCVEAGGGN